MIGLRKAANRAHPAPGTGIAAEGGSAPSGWMARPTDNPARPTRAAVGRFLESIEDDAVRVDCLALIGMMREASGRDPVMWGSSIVGFGSSTYVFESGRVGDFPGIGFSPRNGNIAVYLRGGLETHTEDFSRLGRYAAGKDCLYLFNLGEVDTQALRSILKKSYREG